MSDELPSRIEFLRRSNIEGKKHTSRELLDHLLGTRALLLAWGARPALCEAGLFHSVYGTESYRDATLNLDQRQTVEKLIGPEAESLAWIFCAMKRESLYANLGRPDKFSVQNRLGPEPIPLRAEDLADLVNLTIANGLEPLLAMSPSARAVNLTWPRKHLCPFRSHALPAAQEALDELFRSIPGGSRKWWQLWK